MRCVFLIPLFCALFHCGKKGAEDPVGVDRDPVTEKPIRRIIPLPPDVEAELKQQAEAPLKNGETLKNLSGVAALHGRGFRGQGMKIAIFDNGFFAAESRIGKTLAKTTRIIEGPVNPQDPTIHGTKLAELVALLAPEAELLLYNASGLSNLAAAVGHAVREKVHVVIYAQVWEFGDNFDGNSGFILPEIARALDAGILWVNAVGNYRKASYLDFVKLDKEKNLQLPFEKQWLRLRVDSDETPVKVTLSWNDFQSTKTYRTAQDLNVYLLAADRKQIIARSELSQDGKDHGPDSAYSAHAREQFEVDLKKGEYFIRAEAKSDNFPTTALFRLSAMGDKVTFVDRKEELSAMLPSTNGRIIGVGAKDDDRSGIWRVNGVDYKPDVFFVGKTQWDVLGEINSSSTATALAGAALTLHLQEMQKTCSSPCSIERKDLIARLKKFSGTLR